MATQNDLILGYQPLDADLTDLADGSLTASKVAGVADADYGDVTVSSGSWAVEDDSHNHVISNVDNLQDSLNAANAYIDSNYVLTSETSAWDKTASDDVTVTILND